MARRWESQDLNPRGLATELPSLEKLLEGLLPGLGVERGVEDRRVGMGGRLKGFYA